MNYAKIKWTDISNGPGVRVSLYVSGCRNHCKGCFNPETWDFGYGDPFTEEVENSIIDGMKPDYIKGFTLVGGDPFEPENQKALAPFLEKLRAAYPAKSIWCFTGYDFEKDLLTGKLGDADLVTRMLSCLDVLVDGRFVEELKNPGLWFRGSSNQRVILVQQSLARDEVVRLVAITDRLYVRKFNECDEEGLYEILGDGQTMKFIEPPFTRDGTREFLCDICIGKGYALAAELKDTGKLIGYILIKPCGDGLYETGWIFHKDYRGRGYAYEAVNAVFDYAFAELGASEFTASADERNQPSLNLIEKLGMKYVRSEKEDGNLLLVYMKNKGNK